MYLLFIKKTLRNDTHIYQINSLVEQV